MSIAERPQVFLISDANTEYKRDFLNNPVKNIKYSIQLKKT